MNKNFIRPAALCGVIAATALFTGCSDYSEFTKHELEFDKYNEQYDETFVKRFGTPDPNHDWGMHPLAPSCFGSNQTTRAELLGSSPRENNVNVNRNQWCERDNNGYKNQPYVLANSLQIPGWPNFDGYYYTNRGEGSLRSIVGQKQIDTDYQLQPAGDVTEYEINYVSTWFRTHKNPGKISLHLSDFFIQNVSQDNDQLEYIGAVDCGRTEIPQGLGEFTPIQGKPEWWNGNNANIVSQVLVDNSFDKKRNDNIAANVKRNPAANHPNSNEALQYSMDYLHFRSMSGNNYTGTAGFNPDGGWTHINNFNNGNSNIDPENKTDKGFREIKYVHSSGTEDFIARCSMGSTDKNWINDWVLVRLEWMEPGADGVERQREGYYLAFDFHNSTQETIIEPDGFYSNWIVKITPIYYTRNNTQNARVMCEDLGGAYDFDFNDVVFDVAYDTQNGGNGEAVINILAAGGTLPIKVGDVGDQYEAHNMLGLGENLVPINVDKDVSAGVATYRLPVQQDWIVNGQLDFEKIPVLVDLEKTGTWTNTNINVHEFDKNKYDKEYGIPSHTVDKTKDNTPRKFATALGVDWMKEEKWIDKGYGKFKKWVQDKNYSYGLDQNETGNGISLYWYDDITNDDLIHTSPASARIAADDEKKQIKWLKMTEYEVEEGFDNKGYALDLLTIAGYEGANSIVKKFENENLQMATVAYIVKAPAGNKDFAAQSSVHGLILPIWIIDKKPYYVHPDGTKVEVSPTGMLNNINSYKPGIWQSSFNRSGLDGETVPATDMGQGVDADGNYTFVIKYGYAKENLYVKPQGEDKARYCDYLGFYVFENKDNATNYNGGRINQTTPVKMFEAYVIF